MSTTDDLDWARAQLVELERLTWAPPDNDATAHAALVDAVDALRVMADEGRIDRIRAVRADYEACERSGGALEPTRNALVRLISSVAADAPPARPGQTPATTDDEQAADLDWIRQRIVELDDRQRSLPSTDIAARHALLEATDGLRSILRDGHTERIHAAREGWEARAGRKGGHEVDHDVIAAVVRSMMPSQGR